MAAPRGNAFWKLRSKSGRDKIFESPESLWQSAAEYFHWVDTHPLKEQKAFGSGMKVTVNLMRAYTQKGLFLFLDIDENTWQRYRKEEPYKDFWAIISRIDDIIYTQKFEGAAAGLLNANLIARELGISDNVNQKHTGTLGLNFIFQEAEGCDPLTGNG